MKRFICFAVLIVCINNLSYSQIINETIPKFAESLFTLNKASVENNIINRGFKVLTSNELISLGYEENSINNLIVGIGDSWITCKIFLDNAGRNVERVRVGGVRYLNAQYMINEYRKEGYIMDEDASTRTELIFVKQTDKFYYFCLVEFMVEPNVCMANAEFRKVAKK